jgi:hypothetical protein
MAWKLRKRRSFEKTDRCYTTHINVNFEERRRKYYNVVHKLVFLQVPFEEVHGVNEILGNLFPVFCKV